MSPGIGGPKFLWLAAAAFAAGLVRGFTGFGTALIYLPVAGQVLSPFGALTTLVLMDLVAPLPGVPRAIRDGAPADILRLAAGLVLFMPLGVYVLTLIPPEVFRWAVSALAVLLVLCLVAGVRYRGRLSPPLVFGTGGASGLLAGTTGLAGPPVILFYMASTLPAAAIRANTLLFLVIADVAMIAVLAGFGRLDGGAVAAGAALTVPCLLGNVAGGRLFDPARERTYRAAAYLVILGSALSGLPLWD